MSAQVEALATVIEAGWGDPTWDGKTLRPLDRQIATAVLQAGYVHVDDARRELLEAALRNVDETSLGSSGFADAIRDGVRAAIGSAVIS